MKAFGSDDHTKICIDILEKGELRVAGKGRESQLSSQFRDIATIVMQRTIRELQKHFPIKRSPMRLPLSVLVQNFPSLMEKLEEYDASVVSKDESGTQMSTVCEMEPGLFRECDSLVMNLQGRLEILAVSVHAEGDTSMDHYDEHDDMA